VTKLIDRGRGIALLMVFETATLAAIASLHLGGVLQGSEPFRPTIAGIAEAIIGLALVIGAAALLRRSHRARPIAIATTVFAIAGFVVGLGFTLRGGGAVDVAYHVLMLPVLLLTLVVLVRQRRSHQASPPPHDLASGRLAVGPSGAIETSTSVRLCLCEPR
jgi:peptidoglycan/LPS O-acetylase OafA/YrhL